MRRIVSVVTLAMLSWPVAAAELPVLVYHDIVRASGADQYAITELGFREQMAYLKRAGYRPLSLREVAAIAAGRGRLPDKPVLLTFDDGLQSFRRTALPILDEYGYPAVLSVVTGWLDGENIPASYSGRLMDWEDVRAVSRRPHVEILSHTHNLHHGVPANPQGNEAPASITRRYDAATDRYESEAAFRTRIRADLTRSVQRLRAETGRAPPGVSWPYGFHDRLLGEEADRLGMRWQLVLNEVPARTEQFPRINRVLLRSVNTLAAFENVLQFTRARRPLRFMEIELDEMAGRSPAEQEQWLSALLTRLQLLRVNAVVVSPFTRAGRQAFFRNDSMPMRAEVLHRVLHQIRTRAGVGQILLRIPDAPGIMPAASELARRHPYDGVILDGNFAHNTDSALRVRFEYYRPGLRCGRSIDSPSTACDDFRVVTLEPGKPQVQVRDDRESVYYLVHNRPDEPGQRVIEALRSLGDNGARHYGLRDGEFLHDPVNLRRVAVEMARHSAAGARR